MDKQRVAQDKSELVEQLPEACSDEAKALEFMEQQRWHGEPFCPHCGCFGAVQMRDRASGERNKRGLWRCKDCGKQFSVRIGTVLEDSRIPLRHWCYAFWAACSSKKGVSALQIKRMTGLSYKSALFLMHRVRYAMADEPGTAREMGGVIEADETYIGGKPRNQHRQRVDGKPNYGAQAGNRSDKACVVALVERGGEIRPVHVDHRIGRGARSALINNVSRDARLMTDESPIYRKIGQRFASHETVKHSAGEYVRLGAQQIGVHVNTAESFFALLKRGVNGTFHSVSKKHLHRYLSEFQFRWNTRGLEDGARTAEAIRRAQFKRLTYREPVRG